MNLLLDQGTPRSAATILRRAGLDAVHTGEIGLSQAEDSEIINRASTEDRIVVTLDADFHTQLALTQASRPSVIRIRMEGLRAEEFSKLLQNFLLQCAEDLEAGAMVSVNEHQIRVRRLPPP
jgi:predicted nuclease of predicted toxin-antitoxin system